jgi:hypothetical protein
MSCGEAADSSGMKGLQFYKSGFATRNTKMVLQGKRQPTDDYSRKAASLVPQMMSAYSALNLQLRALLCAPHWH